VNFHAPNNQNKVPTHRMWNLKLGTSRRSPWLR